MKNAAPMGMIARKIMVVACMVNSWLNIDALTSVLPGAHSCRRMTSASSPPMTKKVPADAPYVKGDPDYGVPKNSTPLQVAAKFGQKETLRVMEEFATPAQRLLLACNRGDREAARAIHDFVSRTRRKPRLLGGTPDAQPPARASRMKSVT